jgi:hypothetical protein
MHPVPHSHKPHLSFPFLLFSALLTPGSFYETIWHGESIGDGADPAEAMRAYAALIPRDGSWNGDWQALCSQPGADPHLLRYRSFEAFLDNEDALERIPVTGLLLAASMGDGSPSLA